MGLGSTVGQHIAPINLRGITPYKGTSSAGTTLVFAGWVYLLHYQSISGEILPHFHVKNIFLAQILSELEHI